MFLSFKHVVFACLSLASAGASLSNDDLLKKMDELEGSIKELEKTIMELADNKGSSNRMRRLKGGTTYSLDRNICYSTDDSIEVFVECEATIDDYYDGYAGCTGSNRRVLTDDHLKRNLQEMTAKRKLYCEPGGGFDDGETVISPFGFFEIGAIAIGATESLMVELTVSTITAVAEELDEWFTFWGSASEGYAVAGVYVTASMWEDCDTFATCTGTEVVAEPMQWIPLHVLYKDAFNFVWDDDYTGLIEQVEYTQIETTTTAKLFFPDSNLVDDTTYFLTLEFSVEVAAYAHACYGQSYAYMFAKAVLGPYIIDAEIIKDADFGNCAWLDSDIDGCGLFDVVSGSVDVNCNV